MTGLELIAGYLAAWVVRKARRAGGRMDQEADAAIDAGLDRLHDVVARKLGEDPALMKLEQEAENGQEVTPRTRQRVELAVADAADEDRAFAAEVREALQALDRTPEARATFDLRGAKGVIIGDHGQLTVH